jgi:single-stranded-DNA-specific exonuclease
MNTSAGFRLRNPRLTFKAEPDAESLRILRQQLNIHPAFLKMLLRLGVRSFSDARDFFRPTEELLHDPFLMEDMETAVSLLQTAIEKRLNILFWGDYDVDGTTATALMMSFFKDFLHYDRVDYYIPDRYKEGYGLSRQGIDYAADNDFSLLIALDCGIRALDEIHYARHRGLDVIVCDHHMPGMNLPDASAILNPKKASCPYPFKELSGCGIAFKLAQALGIYHGFETRDLLPLTDLVAISTCADIVPLVGENRVLVHLGMRRIKEAPRPALRVLMESAGLESERFDTEDIVFVIGPRINAAGRIEHGRLAVQMLLEQNEQRLRLLADTLERLNAERRQHDRNITAEALSQVGDCDNRFAIVVYDKSWHKGVVGIVAARLTERFYLPSVVLTLSEGQYTGSARSIPGFDLFEALNSCAELLDTFGGHAHAAGLTLQPSRLDPFIQTFNEIAARRFCYQRPEPDVLIDDELTFAHLTPPFVKLKNQFGPFGPDNMDPVFLSRGLIVHDNEVVEFGEGHLRFKVRQPSSCATAFPVVAFNLAPWKEYLTRGSPFDLAYNLSLHGRNELIELEAKALIPLA